MIRLTLLAACVLAACAGLAGAQDSDQPQPTLGQRLGNFGRNLFGASDDYDVPPSNPRPMPTSKSRARMGSASNGTMRPKTPRSAPTADAPASDAPTARVAQNNKLFDAQPPASDDAPPTPSEELAPADDSPAQGSLAPAPSSRRGAALAPVADRQPSVDDSIAPLPSDEGRLRPSPLRETPTPRVARSERLGGPLPTERSREPAALPTDDADRVLITRKSPNISIETTGPRRITVGKAATYTVTVSNVGDVAASDVVVYVSLPDWAEVAGAQASSGSTGTSAEKSAEGYQWRVSSLAAHSRQELSLRIIPRKSQPLDLAVRWTCSPSSSQATVEVDEPKLEMAISGPTDVIYGEHQLYKLTISNPGTGDADAVTIQLEPINPNEGTTATHRMGKLPAGSSKTVEIELTARQAGHISIKADAAADGDLKASAIQNVLVRRAGLQVSITGPKLHYAGSPAAYEIRVKNPGDATAQNVSIVATVPPEVTLASASGNGQVEAGQNRVVWPVDEIAAGSETSVSFKCLMRGTGSNRIEATASADDLKESALVSTQVMALADLVLEVTDTPGPIPVGQETTFDVQVRNRGSNSAEQIELVAYFSDGFEPTTVEGGKYEMGAGTVLFKPIGSLAAGAETSFKIKARANTAGNHRIRVELQCKTLGTRLTREDSTLFYGEDGTLPSGPAAANPATPSEEDGPQPHLAPKR
ncbi:MAG TPA: CARDB domain-containing protein [Pirellulales bacterium]